MCRKMSLALKSTAHHYFRFAFILLFGGEKKKTTKKLANFTQAPVFILNAGKAKLYFIIQ